MLRTVLIGVVGLIFVLEANALNTGKEVMDYDPGVGYAVEYGTGLGYTNTGAALGMPSSKTVDPDPMFGGTYPVNPFSPPYLSSQLVSIGEGGYLTMELNAPVPNAYDNPFGIDFIVYGNSGFVITNGDYSGGGITGGGVFSANADAGKVYVSEDNTDYFRLDPSGRRQGIDGLFPTDGNGRFGKPVNPSLTADDFAGAGLEEIRDLYAGSGGGKGFDIDWAVDEGGDSVELASIKFVRFEVLSGHSEIDAVTGIGLVPEPASGFLFGAGLCVLAALSLLGARRN
ncbi:MAG: PEP-CTERM sorting domain-containing protein [Verrucomicrobia bacterium]|nr:PEP-CTERM sorting domain-containing protein [Verrucomicrobiota bacterium]